MPAHFPFVLPCSQLQTWLWLLHSEIGSRGCSFGGTSADMENLAPSLASFARVGDVASPTKQVRHPLRHSDYGSPKQTHALPKSLLCLGVGAVGRKSLSSKSKVTSSSRTAYTDVPRASLVVPEVAIGQSTMPAIAFGVGSRWLEDEDREERLKRSIHSALDAGFRHLDDAEAYGMQELLGEAIHEWMEKSGAKREELFMTSKVWSLDGDIVAKCRQLLKDSRLDYFDLLLVHCACTEAGDPFKKPLPAIWEEMMSIKQSGLAKEIGVSNWRIQDLESIKDAEIQPVCNQVEAHVFLQQVGLREYCRRRNIVMTCYGAQAPVARLECLDEAAPLLQEALAKSCERHGRNVGQILLRWAYQNDLITVTTSTKIERIRQSLEIFDFELSQEEIGVRQIGPNTQVYIFVNYFGVFSSQFYDMSA